MNICWRGLHRLQLMNLAGDVRVCGWIRDDYVGNLLQNDFPEIMHGERMQKIIAALASGNYEICNQHACPYLSNDKMDEMLVEATEIPDYPDYLSLSYEHRCNYQCSGCFSYHRIEAAKHCRDGEAYARLEERLTEVLPHIKHIAANGAGEVFASPHTLKMLSKWKPLAPVEACKASLETNGSLFTPENWNKIENLGQYHLSVTITIMSFQEDIYQFLSGTKLPVSVIEENLRFVRSLREQGIINYLSLGSVMQEANFREMPQFIQRCLEEYGADRVHIRQIRPGGHYSRNIQWFFDVRNPHHPYHPLYQDVIHHPVFLDSRVRMDSGYLLSERGEDPCVKLEQQINRHRAIEHAVNQMLDDPELLSSVFDANQVAVFGLGTVGRLVVRQYGDRIKLSEIFMSKPKCDSYQGIPIRILEDAQTPPDLILVTVYHDFQDVSNQIHRVFGEKVKIINIWNLIK